MRRIHLVLSAFSLLLFSCGPVINLMEVDVKLPADFPLDISEKRMAVFVPQYDTTPLVDSSLMRNFSEALSQELAVQGGLNQGDVPLYSHYCGSQALGTLQQATYAQDLADGANAQMIFLIDSVHVGGFDTKTVAGSATIDYRQELLSVPFWATIRVYDAEKQSFIKYIPLRDSIVWQLWVPREKTSLALPASTYGDLQNAAVHIGSTLAQSFTEQWETQDRVLFVYGKSPWKKAYKYAVEFEWEKARDTWLTLLEEAPTRQMSACAAYNLAVYAEMAGDFALAKQWLDYADKTSYLQETSYYKTVIDQRVAQWQKKAK